MPVGASSFTEAMRMGSEVYHHLKVCSFFSLLPFLSTFSFNYPLLIILIPIC